MLLEHVSTSVTQYRSLHVAVPGGIYAPTVLCCGRA